MNNKLIRRLKGIDEKRFHVRNLDVWINRSFCFSRKRKKTNYNNVSNLTPASVFKTYLRDHKWGLQQTNFFSKQPKSLLMNINFTHYFTIQLLCNHKYYLLDISSSACGISDLLLEVYSSSSLLENMKIYLKKVTTFPMYCIACFSCQN